jgi:hypothetical protein
MDNKLKEKFYTQISTELEFCDKEVTPLLCYNYSEPSLRASLIETIAQTCISMKISIAEALVEVERTYSLNSTEG